MINTRIAVVAVALSFVAAAACFAASPQMGTWKLNEAKSTVPAGTGKNSAARPFTTKSKAEDRGQPPTPRLRGQGGRKQEEELSVNCYSLLEKNLKQITDNK